MNWQEMSGAERYRVVELARRGEAPINELCRMFGVSRQTLSLAVEKAGEAAMAALEPKHPGRKGKSAEAAELASVKKERSVLQRDLNRWQQKYEIAMTFVDLQRKMLNGEPLDEEEESPTPPKKKKRRKHRGRSNPQPTSGPNRTGTKMGAGDDGRGDGSEAREPRGIDPPEGGAGADE